MKKLSKSIFILPGALLIVGFAGPVMAHGQEGTDDTSSDTSTTADTNDDSVTSRSVETVREALRHRLEDRVDAVNGHSLAARQAAEDRFKTKADEILSELLQGGAHRHDAATRQKNCQAAEKGLEKKLSTLQTNSSSFLDRVNAVLDKTLTYQQSNNLNPSNLSDLLAKANTAQTDATTAVGNLSSLSVNLDCSSSSVAENVATFKAAASDARSKLLAYKLSVKNIVVALLQTKEGGEQ